MDINVAVETFQGAWPMIQPAISTIFGAVVARLFLRGNTSKAEIEKLRAAKFSNIADALLAEGHISYKDYYKCNNFNKIAQLADEFCKQAQRDDVPKQAEANPAMGFDWFVRFFEDAGNISNEEMQLFWAKILAKEVKMPNSFSLRSFDVLKNLSSREAQMFATISSLVLTDFTMTDAFLYNDDVLLGKFGISFAKVRILQECGLLVSTQLVRKILVKPTKSLGVFRNGSLVCVALSLYNDNAEYEIPIFTLTAVGRELLPIVKSDEDSEFFFEAVRTLGRNYKKYAPLTEFGLMHNDKCNINFSAHYISGYDASGCVQYLNRPIDLEGDKNA
ncbi:MAG: DUF2806 domain-containing protein [Oscillospiraceae bacterium]|jgi:hypothetical protein|nr:DUF2806 domain-containing protein [Oscillospiraceae bacterium]